MRGMVALVGDDFVVEFNDSARAHGRAETASLAEELIYFDMSHIFPLVSRLGILFLLSAESRSLTQIRLTSLRITRRRIQQHF